MLKISNTNNAYLFQPFFKIALFTLFYIEKLYLFIYLNLCFEMIVSSIWVKKGKLLARSCSNKMD